MRILTDRGSEYCGNPQHHEYQLYLAIEDIDHTRTKARHPQTTGICERFHRTMQEEFYATAFRKKVYSTQEELQTDVDDWIREYNCERPHTGRHCYGKTPDQTFQDSKKLALENQLNEQYQKGIEKNNLSSLPEGSEHDARTKQIDNQDERQVLGTIVQLQKFVQST